MKQTILLFFTLMSLLLFSNTQAGESDAIRVCEDKIKSIYGVDMFKHVGAEKTGHNKYDVHGKVKYHDAKHPFSCKVKRDQVRSYHYDGPTKASENSDDHHHHKSHSNRNLAIGVGLAAAVAIAIANSGKKNDQSSNDSDQSNNIYDNSNNNNEHYARDINKDDLEDDCHDAVDGRIKKNYHTIRRVNFKHDTVQHNGTSARGDGRISYYNGDHTSFGFSCKFDNHGRVIDTNYSIY